MSPYSYSYCDFQRFLYKARNAGRSGENAGMREISQNAGFPAWLWEGRHLDEVCEKKLKVIKMQCVLYQCWKEPEHTFTVIYLSSTLNINKVMAI